MKNKIKLLINQILLEGKFLKIIIFRTDRLGDLVLSVNVLELLKDYFSSIGINTYVTFAVNSYNSPILKNNPFIDEILEIDRFDKNDIVKYIKTNDISISLFVDKASSVIPYLANIPIRIAPRTKIYSLLFNFPILQNRSENKKNEAEYNLDLVKKGLNILNNESLYYPKIFLDNEEKNFAEKFLEEHDILKGEKFLIFHPGSSGSSLDLPLEKYFYIMDVLSKKKIKFLVSGKQKELDFYKSKFITKLKYKNIKEKNFFSRELSLRELISVINSSDILISNSTGPLHIAGALGRKTIGFYPKLFTCNSTRWGVFSKEKWKNFVFNPLVPFCNKCSKNCKFYSCMSRIDETEVIDKILDFMEY